MPIALLVGPPSIEEWAKRLYESARELGHDPWPPDELAHGAMSICKPSCLICNPSGTINL
ncbi:MAG: hypothetical protein M3550_07225 [Actinomycetota bacterium]|nr:hypothetical protein [Actinomycetota bacterium]